MKVIEASKTKPEQVKLWGVTGASAVVGAMALPTVTKGALVIASTLLYPSVALPVGLIVGGAIGWRFMQRQMTAAETPVPIIVPASAHAWEAAKPV